MILEVDSVNLSFGHKTILNNVYAGFETGQITGILGRNGCGKSSLFQIIFGSLTADFASVRVDKKYYKNLTTSGLINYLPQHFTIPGHLKLKQGVDLLNANMAACADLFNRYDLSLNSRFEMLSGGQRRLAEVIIFLHLEAKFLILDEPFTHIMPVHIEDLKEMMQAAKATKGIIISDHMYRHLVDISGKVYLIRDAKTHLVPIDNITESLRDHYYIL